MTNKTSNLADTVYFTLKNRILRENSALGLHCVKKIFQKYSRSAELL